MSFPIRPVGTYRPMPARRTRIGRAAQVVSGYIRSISDATGLNTIIGVGLVDPSDYVAPMDGPVDRVMPLEKLSSKRDDDDEEHGEGFEDETFPQDFYKRRKKRKRTRSMRGTP